MNKLAAGEDSIEWFSKFVKAVKNENDKKLQSQKDIKSGVIKKEEPTVIAQWNPDEINKLTKAI